MLKNKNGWPFYTAVVCQPKWNSCVIRGNENALKSWRPLEKHQSNMEKTLYCYRTCDVVTPQQKVGISNLLGWVGSRRGLTIYHKIPSVCTTRSAVISLGWSNVTIGLVALILHAYRSYRWAYSHQTGYNWVGGTYSTCLQVLQVGLLSSDWLHLGWLHLFYMPTGPTGGLTLIRLVTIGLAALILHAYRSYMWAYSHQTGYNWVGCTYSTCLHVLQVGLLSSDWLQLGWLHLFYMPTGPTCGPTLIRLVTIGLVVLILHAYMSYSWAYSHQTGYNWVGCTYSTCLQVLQVGLLSSDWLQLGWLHLFYMPTSPTGGLTLIRLVTIGLAALILHAYMSYSWPYSHQTGYNWVGCTYSTCLHVLQLGLLSSDWLQLGWLYLFYMPTSPTGGLTLIRLVTIWLAALILHAYRSYRWTYSHQTGYNWVGCTYSTCLQVLQVGLLSSDWLQLGWLHLFYVPIGPTVGPTLIRLVIIGLAALILHAYMSYSWAYSHQTGYNWVGCTYSTCLQVLLVGLLSSAWLQLGWLHLFYMPTGPTGGLTLIRLVTIGLAAIILHVSRSYRWTYSHQAGYNWVGCTYSACLQVLQVDLLSSDWLQLGWLHLFYMPTGPSGGPTLLKLVTIGLVALFLHVSRSYRWTYSHQTGYNWVGCTYSTCLQVLQMGLLSSDWLQLGWPHLFYMPTGPTDGSTLIRLVTIGLAALILHAYRSYRWTYSQQTDYNWVGCTYSTCLQVLQVGLLSSDWLQLGWLYLFYMPTGPTGGFTLIRLVTIGLAALILHAYRSYRWAYFHQTGYSWVGCTYSTCLHVLQVGLLSSDWCFRSQSMFHYVLVEVYRIISIYFPEVYPN